MIEFIIMYLIFGAGFYIGLAMNSSMEFLNVPLVGLLRGFILCFLFWPIGLIAKIVMILINRA